MCEVVGGVVCFMKRRVHKIGRISIAVFLEVRRECVPVGAKDIETSN